MFKYEQWESVCVFEFSSSLSHSLTSRHRKQLPPPPPTMSDSLDVSKEKASALEFENSQISQDEKITDQELAMGGAVSFDVDEKAVLRKMDLRLIPMLSILYLLAFLDRGIPHHHEFQGFPIR